MNENVISKIVKFIIYILIFILISLICYNIHLLYKNFFITTPPPKNSVRVSPLTGEPITNVNSSNDIIKIIYNNTQNQYGSLSKASIVYEEYFEGNKILSALFLEDSFTKDSSMDIISYKYSNSIPNFKFIEEDKINNYYSTNIDSINVYCNKNVSSFLYYENNYHHFYNNIEDIDSLNKNSISYKNIIIDISNFQENTLLIFTNGKVKKVNSKSIIPLLQGNTYWVTLDKNMSLLTYYFKIQESLN